VADFKIFVSCFENAARACPHCGAIVIFNFNVWFETRCACGAHLYVGDDVPELLCAPGCSCSLSYFDPPKKRRLENM